MDNQVGILGLGSRSTLFYIEQLNNKFNQQHGGYATFPFKMLNVNFNAYNPYLPDQYEKLIPQLKTDLTRLDKLGVQSILIPNITLHQTVDRLPNDFLPKKKIIHPYELAAEKMKKENIQEAVIFGTIYTMQSEAVKHFFAEYKIKVLPPAREDQLFIDQLRQDIYFDRLEKHQVQSFREILVKYERPQRSGMLACTELSLIANSFSNISLINLVALQIQKALNL